ncbi:hypothetical protein BH23ACT9_BH23ACT9_39760 [soil metagenome]
MGRHLIGYVTIMSTKIRTWLDDDRAVIHHAPAAPHGGMHVPAAEGVTDCGLQGLLTLVHHELVDMGKLCGGCMAVSGVRPPLEGTGPGPS